MLTLAKHSVRKLFDSAGLEVRKKRPPEVPRTSMIGALQQISSLGFKPGTVIDVGAATDTADLYEEFKDSRILLIEPVAEFEPFLRRICSKYDAQYVIAAAGETPGTAVLNVHPDKFGSSLFREVEGASVDGVPRTVPMITVDDLCAEKALPGPYLIKIDVQGAELQVLAGARHTLRQTEVALLEVTLFGTMIGGPQLYDVVSRMKQWGFVLYDLFGLNYRPLDNALCQMDMVFVREDGFFRKFHGFATPDQRKEQFQQWNQYWNRLSEERNALTATK